MKRMKRITLISIHFCYPFYDSVCLVIHFTTCIFSYELHIWINIIIAPVEISLKWNQADT